MAMLKEGKFVNSDGKEVVEVSGIWLRTVGRKVQVLIEVDGHWAKAIEESLVSPVSPISHIVEYAGMIKAPLE